VAEYIKVFGHVGFFFARARHAVISKETHELVRLASAANPFEAHIWEQALAEKGIRCQVLDDNLRGGLGNIPGVRAEIWVEATDLERAEAILCQPAELAGANTPSTPLQPLGR
jgi:hypothetical protein